jgi:hypothetical protein
MGEASITKEQVGASFLASWGLSDLLLSLAIVPFVAFVELVEEERVLRSGQLAGNRAFLSYL